MTADHPEEIRRTYPMLQVINLKKTFDNGLVSALNGMTFEVQKGEIVAVAGPSGCGKTTLLNLIGSLETPSSGRIIVDGKDILGYNPIARYRTEMVGFVFQFHHLVPSLTLLENVELPLQPLRISKKERTSRACQLLEAVGLSDRMQFLPTRVSGGERQRAAIARALINKPCILLADEPTGNLDSETGETIMKFLLTLCREHQTTLVM
jgi:putative ABC transport system ATP-binding protein